MARDDPYFRLRIPESLKAQVEEAAAKNNRSMTAEIISRLEQTFADGPEWVASYRRLEKRVFQLEEETFSQRHQIERLYKTKDTAGS